MKIHFRFISDPTKISLLHLIKSSLSTEGTPKLKVALGVVFFIDGTCSDHINLTFQCQNEVIEEI